MWYFCMMPESKLSPVSFQVWLLQYTIYTFTLVCEIQHYHGPLILHRNALRSHFLHQSSYVALVEYLWAWFASSQKKGCSQTSQKPEQHSLQKRCCNLINRHVAAVCWQNFSCLFSVCGGGGAGSIWIFWVLYKFLYLQKNTCITAPSPSYHWHFVRKTGMSY